MAGRRGAEGGSLRRRSAVFFADKLDVPLLVFRGGADQAIPPSQALALAQKLEAFEKTYELVLYAGDDHAVTRHREERLRKTIEWFKNPPRPSVARVLRKTLDAEGVEAALKRVR